MIQVTNWRRFAGLILIVVLVIVVGMWWLVGGATMQHSGEITIAEGTAARAVYQQFVEEEYTDSIWPWRYAVWRLNVDQDIKAGTYRIEVGESVRTVITRLVEGDVTPDELSVTFPEGFTLEQIAARLEARGLANAEDFIAVAQPKNFAESFPFLADLPENRTLEGYLFPDTYRFGDTDTPEDILRKMLGTFEARIVNESTTEALVREGRTLDEVIIMASIVEREVISDDDMAKVAGVLWKRNDEGMGLDADATVRYALEKWDEALTVTDLATESLYNTRRYRGLPPGPISNPGLRAIQASLNPEATPYYYYLSTLEGETIFSETNDEHNQNKFKYLR